MLKSRTGQHNNINIFLVFIMYLQTICFLIFVPKQTNKSHSFEYYFWYKKIGILLVGTRSDISRLLRHCICSWDSFSMVVKWTNDGLFHVNDGKMLVNDDEMRIWSYTNFTIIDWHFTIINEYFTIISLKCTIIRSFDHHWEAAPTDL